MSGELIHYHPENRQLFAEIEGALFTPESPEDYQYLYHPSVRMVTFMADHLTDKNLEFYVEYIADRLRNPVPVPEFRLPAFKIRRDTGSTIAHQIWEITPLCGRYHRN